MSYRIGIDARKLADFGIGTYVCSLVRALGELDQENRYFLFGGRRNRELLDPLPENFQWVVERAPVYSAREFATLSWRLFRLKLDLYHATHYVLPAVVPCRAVVTIHDIIHLLYPQFLPGPLAFIYAQRMIRRSLTKADRIITDSENTKADLMDYFDVDGTDIDVIHLGVGEKFLAEMEESAVDERLAALGVRRPYLLFVGNPKPHKNLDRIVQAFARAVELGPFDADLICVGDRGNRDFKIRTRAEQSGVGDRVRLLGHVSDDALAALYRGARIFLYPTLYEGFGLPVVEAMACGAPVITSSNSALKEIAYGHAELVDPLDVDGMARAIARLMSDAKLRRRLARAGAKRSREFRWQVTAERTLEVYRDVITGSGWMVP